MSKEEQAKIFLQLALKTDQTIWKANKRLTEKIRGIFAVSSTLIPIIFGLGYFIIKETRAFWMLFPIFLSLITFLSAIILGIWLHRPTDYKYVDPSVIMKKYKGKPLKYIINKFASTWSDTSNHNASIINDKENWLNCMYALVAIGLGILAVSFLLLTVNMN